MGYERSKRAYCEDWRDKDLEGICTSLYIQCLVKSESFSGVSSLVHLGTRGMYQNYSIVLGPGRDTSES